VLVGKRIEASKEFIFGDHVMNSHDLYAFLCTDMIVFRPLVKLILAPRVSSEGYDRRIILGLKFSIPGFFG